MEQNIYDLCDDKTKKYPYCAKSRHYIRIIYLIRAAAIVCMVGGGVLWNMIDRYFQPTFDLAFFSLFLLLWGLSCVMLHFLLMRANAGRVTRMDAQTIHDYDYYIYVHSAKNRRNMCLLIMAQKQVELGHVQTAFDALRLFECQKANKNELHRYYLLQAILCQQTGNRDGFQKQMEYCRMTANDEIVDAVDMDQALELLKNRLHGINREQNYKTNKALMVLFLGSVYVTLAFLYLNLESHLPAGLEYRRWFTVSGHMIIWTIAILAMLWLLVKLNGVNNRQIRAGVRKWIMKFCLILIGVCLMILSIFRGFLGLLELKTEIENQDGTLTVINDDYNRSYRYVYQKRGIFLREYIGLEEENSEEPSTSIPSTSTTAGTTTESGEEKITDADLELHMQYLAVFDAIGQHKTYEFQYSAKGQLYLLIKPKQNTAENMVGWRIVYDRESKNGACSEFVYYKDIYETDSNQQQSISSTEIINFYAVKHRDRKVIAANKSSWGGGGDTAYREATGE